MPRKATDTVQQHVSTSMVNSVLVEMTGPWKSWCDHRRYLFYLLGLCSCSYHVQCVVRYISLQALRRLATFIFNPQGIPDISGFLGVH